MTKIKGIPLWEQYLEYIVFGVAVLVFLTLLSMQFILQPNKAEVGSKTYLPGNVDAEVEAAAEQLRPMLTDTAPSPIEIPDPEPLADTFVASRTEPTTPSETLLAWHRGAVLEGFEIAGGVGPQLPYRMPDIEAPYDVVTAQYFDALNSDLVQGTDGLAKYFDGEPYDLTWTTVASRFDLADVLASFKAESEAFAAVPATWHRDRAYVLDVVLERQTKTADGWSEPEVVEALPGQLSLRSELDDDADAALRERLLVLLEDTNAQLSIVQPEFYQTRNNAWLPPTFGEPEADDAGPEGEVVDNEEQQRILSLRRQLDNLQKKLAVVRSRQEALGCADMDLDSPPGRNRGSSGSQPSGGGGGDSFGGGGGLNQPTDNDAQDERDRNTCISLQRREKSLSRQFEQRAAELERLTDERVEMVDDAPAVDPLEQDTIVLWAHDLSVEPYEVYRYRFRVQVYNPFFARGPYLTEDQQDLASSITIASERSEWSEPMTVRPAFEDFIVRAEPARSQPMLLGGELIGSAKVEVYRFQHGRWWMETFSVEPGDRIGASMMMGSAEAKVEVDFRTDWFVLDILADFQASPTDVQRDRGAMVQLQNMVTGEISEPRRPRHEFDSGRRRDLVDAVDFANAPTEVAMGAGDGG